MSPVIPDPETQLAMTADWLNTWAREIGVSECNNPCAECELRELCKRIEFRVKEKIRDLQAKADIAAGLFFAAEGARNRLDAALAQAKSTTTAERGAT